MNIKQAGALFLSGLTVGLILFFGFSALSAPSPARAALGNDIVCLVYSDLNSFGSPVPLLNSDNCPGGSSTSTLPTLTVTKVVIGGAKHASDFPLFINGKPVMSGTPTTTLPGIYTVTETNTDSAYTGTFSGDCDAAGRITLVAGTATALVSKTCTLTNTYTASGGGNGGGGGTPTASSSDLSIVKTISSSTPYEGDTVTYTLTVHNSGPDAATHVLVGDLLPRGLTYVSDNGSGAYNPATGVWTVGTVSTTSNASLSIVATIGSITSAITNTATIAAASSTDPDTANNSASVNITPLATSTGSTTNGGGNGGGSGTTPPVTPTGNGGGGGGVVSGPLSYGFGGDAGGGMVLGTSTQAEAPSCGEYLSSYLRLGHKNTTDQVKKLQTFLNNYMDIGLPVTGYFGGLTFAAVEKFQVKEYASVLVPWVPYGLPTPQTPTGYVYKTTRHRINEIMCSTLNAQMPSLP